MKSNNNQDQQVPRGLNTLPSSVDNPGEGSDRTPFFHTSPGFSFETKKEPCEYQNTICPPNIPKYSMKCNFNKEGCRIRRWFKRFEGLEKGAK